MNRLLCVAVLLLSPMHLLPAQDPPPVPAAGRGRAARPADTDPTLSMQFRGGTMSAFVAALRGEQPKANVVLAEMAAKARVPAMELRGAGIEQALEAAAAAASADDDTLDVRVMEFRGPGEPVYSIVAKQRPHPAVASGVVPGGAERVLRVLSLNELVGPQERGIEPVPTKTILSAFELAMQDEADAPRIRFHEDSGLLLVRGTPQQVAVLQEVLQTLEHDQQVRAQRAMMSDQARQQQEREQKLREGSGGTGERRDR